MATSQQRWVTATREAVARELRREWSVPMSAIALEGNLDIDTWSFGGPLTRTAREISAALNWLVAQGYAERMAEADRTEWDPRGVCYVITPAGIKFADEHPKVAA